MARARRRSNLPRELVHIIGGEIVANVVIAWPTVARQIAGNRRQNAVRGKLQKTSVRDRIDAMAPCVVDLELHPVTEPLLGRQLKAVVMAVGARAELSHRAEARIRRRAIGKRRKASGANRLVSVDLRRVRLVHRARPHILRPNIGAGAELMFERETPLHKVRRAELAVRNGCDRNRRQTRCRHWPEARRRIIPRRQIRSGNSGWRQPWHPPRCPRLPAQCRFRPPFPAGRRGMYSHRAD